jgi:hypothetical protein
VNAGKCKKKIFILGCPRIGSDDIQQSNVHASMLNLKGIDEGNEMARVIVLTSCEETVKYPQ